MNREEGTNEAATVGGRWEVPCPSDRLASRIRGGTPGGSGCAKTNPKPHVIDYKVFKSEIMGFLRNELKKRTQNGNQLILLLIAHKKRCKRRSKTNLNEPKTDAQRVEQAL